MIRRTKTLSALLFAFALMTTPVLAQGGVAGKWTFTMDSPQGQMSVDFVFEQDGTEVTGTAALTAMPEIEATEISDGVYEDGVLFFLLHVSAQGQWFTVEMEADVEGDEMVGEAYMAEMGQASPFTAKRADGRAHEKTAHRRTAGGRSFFASWTPATGLEPVTRWLTASCSTN